MVPSDFKSFAARLKPAFQSDNIRLNERSLDVVLQEIISCPFLTYAISTSVSAQVERNEHMIYPVKVDVTEVRNRLVQCKVRDHVVHVDQPKEFGADDTAPTPPEMLAISLGSCVVSTIQFIAMQKGINVENIHVTVEGNIDFSKAMGMSDKQRSGFAGLNIGIKFDSSLSARERQDLINTVFRCGASIDSIQNTTPVTYEILE
jgi:uncharacterized OsmC-like protein